MDEQVPRSEAFEHSGSIGKLIEALAKARAEFAPALKDRDNPAYRAKYVPLENLIEATHAALSAHGLAVVQMPALEGQYVVLTTILGHTSGEWMSSQLSLPGTMRERFDAQSVGSGITYARRYAYQSVLNIAGEVDDDGNAAVGIGSKEAAQAVGKAKIEAKLGPDDGTLSFTPDEAGMTHLSGISGIATLRANLTEEQKAGLHFVWTGKDWAVPHDSVQDVVRFCTELKIPTKLVPAAQGAVAPSPKPTAAPTIRSATEGVTRANAPMMTVHYGNDNLSVTLQCYKPYLFAYLKNGIGKQASLIIESRPGKPGKTPYQTITGIEKIGEQTFSLNDDGHYLPDIQTKVTDADLPKEMFP